MATVSSDSEIAIAIEKTCLDLGIQVLKPLQKDVVLKFVRGNDVFVALPTGFGKSLCYGCLPGVYDNLNNVKGSIVAVISPLLSLMTDQVARFNKMGLNTSMVSGSGMTEEETRLAVAGHYQLLFITPEAIVESRKWKNGF